MATDDKTGTSTHSAKAETPVVVDLGKQKRKLVRELRDGSGKLLDEVRGAIGELQRAGRLAANVQPVVVVVVEKPKTAKLGKFGRMRMPMMFGG